jgi:hypothetical protein
MAEYRTYRRRPRQSTKALTAKLVALATAATLGIGGFIAAEMAAGDDPALGPKAAAQAKKTSAGSQSSSSSTSSGNSYRFDPYARQQPAPAPSPAPVTSGTS